MSLLAGAACGDDGSGGGDPDTGLGGLLGGDGPIDVCKDFALGDDPPEPPRPTGTAHLSPAMMEDELDLKEVTCETLRDEQGRVAGFFAAFFEDWNLPSQTGWASVTFEGAFNGSGQYEGAVLKYAHEDSTRDSSGTGSLTLDADGLTAARRSSASPCSFRSAKTARRAASRAAAGTPLPQAAAIGKE